MTRTWLALLAAIGTAARSSGPVECAPSNDPAVALRPVDAGSSAPLAGLAIGTTGFGGYTDSLKAGPDIYAGPDSLRGGLREGTYSIHVEVAGYAPFDTAGVVVGLTPGACRELVTQRFTARLTALP
ncbi:MAG TPA: hypothetical protein VJN95_15185 [Gemmatimonadales bacterium]|nr:hypothetical protein [Gemmatimonadales bacterium]